MKGAGGRLVRIVEIIKKALQKTEFINCMLKYLCALALTSFNAVYASQYSIQELLTIAEENAGNVKAAEYFRQSQEDLARQEKYWNNPSLAFNKGSVDNSFGVNQTIPFYSKLQKKYDIQNVETSILGIQKQNLALLVKAEVFALVYQYYGTQMKIVLLQKRLARLSSVDNYLTGIVLTSPTKHSQAYIVKDKINLIKRDVIILQNNLVQIWNRINIFTELSNRPDISAKWIDGKYFINKRNIITLALESNLELKEQKQLVEKYKAEVSFAKVEQMPDVGISVSTFSGAQKSNQGSYGIGATVSVPLINTNKYKIAGLNSKVMAQEFSYQFRKNQVEKLIASDINEYDTLLEISQIFPVSRIDTAITRLASANADFKKGILDFITYIELDTQEYEVINSVIDTQVGVATTYANLMVKSGNFVMPKYE